MFMFHSAPRNLVVETEFHAAQTFAVDIAVAQLLVQCLGEASQRDHGRHSWFAEVCYHGDITIRRPVTLTIDADGNATISWIPWSLVRLLPRALAQLAGRPEQNIVAELMPMRTCA